MGYFSNGSEGSEYEQRYCARCIHVDGKDGKSGCPVWLAHLLKNYEECDDKDSVLHLLIPRTPDGLGNAECTMFVERT